jgi:CRISPR/Cas system CMR subunit Cmr6 (Cas7 group RAMP superfamily)
VRGKPPQRGGPPAGGRPPDRQAPSLSSEFPAPRETVRIFKALEGASNALTHPLYTMSKFVGWNDSWSRTGVNVDAFRRTRAAVEARVNLAASVRARRAAWLNSLERRGLARRAMLTAGTDVVVGLAGAGPLELGLSLHHVYGFPILPASSLKGLAKASGEGEGLAANYGEPDRAGGVTLLDGLPAEVWRVQLDVMTPHAPRWYRRERDRLPDDTDNPIPISFLSVASGSRFEVGMIARNPERADEALAAVVEDLRRGLHERGLGAKTAAGYGVFSLDVLPSLEPMEEATSPVGPPSPPQPSAVARGLAQFISALRLAEVRPQVGRVESDLARCRPEERGPLAEQFEARLRELRMKDRDVRELMDRVRRVLGGGEGGAA